MTDTNLFGQSQWARRGEDESKLRSLEMRLTALTNAVLTSSAGIQIRQGTVVITTDVNGLGVVTYAVAFPNGTLTVVANEGQGGLARIVSTLDPGFWTATGFSVVLRDSAGAPAAGGHRINYIAIGN